MARCRVLADQFTQRQGNRSGAMSDTYEAAQGQCTCGQVRFQLTRAPLFVHCCHCTWCQRESGSAFALNALIETESITLLDGKPEAIMTPSNSGKGQNIMRCPSCQVALWSHYVGAGEALSFVRVGCMQHANDFAPDIHIFTDSKQPWVVLPQGSATVPQYYRATEFWPEASLERRAKLFAAKA